MRENPESLQKRFASFQARGLAMLRDDQSHSKRAVLVAAGEKVSPVLVNEIIALARGLTFVSITAERAATLMLQPMGHANDQNAKEARFASRSIAGACASVEAREGVTTGISAKDRSKTIQILSSKNPSPRDLVKPGHIFPVIVSKGGVLVKNSLPEGSLDLVTANGFRDSAVFSDLLGRDGDYLDEKGQDKLAKSAGIPLITLSELIRLRLETEQLVYPVAEAKLPTREAGELRSVIFRSKIHDCEHFALIKGDINPDQSILTRVQPEFTFADVFGGDNPPTRKQITAALQAIGERGSGVLVYLRQSQDGRLMNQIKDWKAAFEHKPASMMREYGVGAQILRSLGVRKIELLTGSSKKLRGITTFGLEITGQRTLATQEPRIPPSNIENEI